MARTRTPIKTVGVAGVAAWLNVTPQLVTKWLLRYTDTPVPDVEIHPGRHGVPDRAWKDTPERKAEWAKWNDARPGQGAPGQPKPRRAKESSA
jgi:hypothetical protein